MGKAVAICAESSDHIRFERWLLDGVAVGLLTLLFARHARLLLFRITRHLS